MALEGSGNDINFFLFPLVGFKLNPPALHEIMYFHGLFPEGSCWDAEKKVFVTDWDNQTVWNHDATLHQRYEEWIFQIGEAFSLFDENDPDVIDDIKVLDLIITRQTNGVRNM